MYYLLSIPGVAVALIAAGFLYQYLGSHFDRLRYAREGRWIDIGDGRKHYLLEKGSGDSGEGLSLCNDGLLRSRRPGLEQSLPDRAHAEQHCGGAA